MNGEPEDHTALRIRLCTEVSRWLSEYGGHLWELGHGVGDDELCGIGILCQMNGQLGSANTAAFESGNWYAGACITRQLVENQYLLAYFASDPAQAARWVTASPNRLEKSFKPSLIRSRLDASGTDYRIHCKIGGHAAPSAAWLLPNHTAPLGLPALWIDLAQHLAELVEAATEAVKGSRLDELLSLADPDMRSGVEALVPPVPLVVTDWLTGDPFAGRAAAENVPQMGSLLREVFGEH